MTDSIADVLLMTMALVAGPEYAAANARKARLMSRLSANRPNQLEP